MNPAKRCACTDSASIAFIDRNGSMTRTNKKATNLRSWLFCLPAAHLTKRQAARRFASIPAGAEAPDGYRANTAYWLAPEAGAAAPASEAAVASEAAAPASEAAAVASLAAAAAPEAAAVASEAAAAGAEAAVASLAGAAAWSLLLLHAASATAASRDATRRDFFMITSFYG